MTGLNEKNTELITLLTATNEKLDTLITLWGGAPPSGVTTLADVVAVLDDIHLDTQSIDLKLLAIRNAIIPQAGDTDPHYPMQTALTRFYDSWLAWLNDNDLDWAAIMGTPSSISDNVLTWLSGIGHVTGDATTTILGRLTAIEGYASCLCAGGPPNPSDPNTCENPLVSISQQNDTESYVGLTFVRWPDDLPSGIVFTTDLGISVPNAEISASPPHSGAKLYVSSSSASVFQASPGNVTQYPTNQWVTIPTDEWTLAPCAPAGNDLVAYLCDNAPPFLDCVEKTSDIVTVTYPSGTNPASHTRYATDLSDLGLEITNLMVIGGNTYSYNNNIFVANDDLFGVSVELTSGPFARIVMVDLSGSATTHDLTSVGQTHTVGVHTSYFSIDNWTSNDISPGSAFTVELCPAGPA